MDLSIFDIFKIGIGPSSSHTVGPMKAAYDFVSRVDRISRIENVARVEVDLYGSLALTGRGHGTDRAVLLGLSGENPEEIVAESIDAKVGQIRADKKLALLGRHNITFEEPTHLRFNDKISLPFHPNGMRFAAFSSDGNQILQQAYYSIGGGFIQRENETRGQDSQANRKSGPSVFRSAAELLSIAAKQYLPIWRIVLENEHAWRTPQEVQSGLDRIWNTMNACIDRGLRTEGILPGGLGVRRRAAKLARKLRQESGKDPLIAMDWVNAYAMAVNEENASGGRVVTAPTNGAAGVVPAVGRHYESFVERANHEGIYRYLLTAGAIGMLYKRNASISGAEVGCQGEVGVACSMAAGGLVAAHGGTNDQVEYAAEIGMEHNLGMTCDPIGGLVQIPCIERNAMGAVKAINACRVAMREGGDHKVSLDQVIETMYRTGLDMQSGYKETSLRGLALHTIEC